MKNKSATIASMTKIRIEGLKSIDISLRECFNDAKIQIIGHDSSRNDEFIFLLPVLSPVACKNFNSGENKVGSSKKRRNRN